MACEYDEVFRKIGIEKLWLDFTICTKDVADAILVIARESDVLAFLDDHPSEKGVFVWHTMDVLKTCRVYKKECSHWFERKKSDGGKDVYFVQCGDDGPIKIGMASNIKSRINDIQSMCPYQLSVIGSIPNGGKVTERLLHEKFSSLRIHGEWFSPGSELISFVSEL